MDPVDGNSALNSAQRGACSEICTLIAGLPRLIVMIFAS
jgi:hypothetical protein